VEVTSDVQQSRYSLLNNSISFNHRVVNLEATFPPGLHNSGSICCREMTGISHRT